MIKVPVFFKKNKILSIVLLLTVLLSLFLGIITYSSYSEVQDIIRKIDEDKQTVDTINTKSKPNPVQRSADLINEDTKRLKQKTDLIRRTFGKPYRQALAVFLKALKSDVPLPDPPKIYKNQRVAVQIETKADAKKDTAKAASGKNTAAYSKQIKISLNEDEILAKFADVYNEFVEKEKEKSNDRRDIVKERERLFQKFRAAVIRVPGTSDNEGGGSSMKIDSKAYETEAGNRFDAAVIVFMNEIQSRTNERLVGKTDGLIRTHQILMAALGLPRSMDPLSCKAFIDNMHDEIKQNRSVPGAHYRKDLNAHIKKITFDHSGKPPVPVMVMPIIRHFQIVEDLLYRMKLSGIQSLDSLKLDISVSSYMGAPVAEMDGDFLKFVYKMKISSNMEEIRKFINCLHDAYKENRVYIIKSIELNGSLTELNAIAGVLDKYSKKAAEENKNKETEEMEPGKPGTKSGAEKNKKDQADRKEASQEPEMVLLQDPATESYGEALLGIENIVHADLVIEYWIYDADNLKAKEKE